MKLQESIYFILNKLKESGTDKLSIDENGYLKISDMYFNTPYDSGYILDKSGNLTHQRAVAGDYFNIKSNDGSDRIKIYFEDSEDRSYLNFNNNILSLVNQKIDLKEANNNISNTCHPSIATVVDTNGRVLSRVEGIATSYGDVGFNIYADNYNSRGGSIGRAGIQGYVDKNGNVTYEIHSPDKFKAALDLDSIVKDDNDDLRINGRLVIDGGIKPTFKSIASLTYTTVNGWGSVGNITIPQDGLYRIKASYNNSAVLGMSYGSVNSSTIAATTMLTEFTSGSSIDDVFFLPGGQWKFWVKCATANVTNSILIWQI